MAEFVISSKMVCAACGRSCSATRQGKIIPVRKKENNIEPSYTMDVMFTFPAFDFNVVLSLTIYS